MAQPLIAEMLDLPDHLALVAVDVSAINVSQLIFPRRLIQDDVKIRYDMRERHPVTRNCAEQTGEGNQHHRREFEDALAAASLARLLAHPDQFQTAARLVKQPHRRRK